MRVITFMNNVLRHARSLTNGDGGRLKTMDQETHVILFPCSALALSSECSAAYSPTCNAGQALKMHCRAQMHPAKEAPMSIIVIVIFIKVAGVLHLGVVH
jgi:hypothetical protein